MGDSPLPPPHPSLPIHHMILMGVSYVSMTLYVWIIVIICKNRKKHVQLQSAFYDLLMNQASADLCMFLVIELLFRPRKYRMFSIYTPQENTLFAKFSYFSMVTVRGALSLGYLPFAFNRFTIFYLPILHDKVWSRRTTISCLIIQWTVPIVVNISAFFIIDSNVSFQMLPSGVLQMMSDTFIGYVDSVQAIVIGGLVTVVCAILYMWTFRVARKKKMPAHIAKNEIRLLICASVTFIPMLLEALRNIVQLSGMYIFGSLDIFVACTEVFFHTTELSSVIQPWAILLTNRLIRRLLCKGSNAPHATLISTNTADHSHPQPKTPTFMKSVVEIKMRTVRRNTHT